MDYARLETAKLAHVDDTYYYGANCRSCLRSRRLSLVRLRATLGDDFPLKDVRPRLKCQTCGSRQIVITFLAPNQAVGNLASLFHEQPV